MSVRIKYILSLSLCCVLSACGGGSDSSAPDKPTQASSNPAGDNQTTEKTNTNQTATEQKTTKQTTTEQKATEQKANQTVNQGTNTKQETSKQETNTQTPSNQSSPTTSKTPTNNQASPTSAHSLCPDMTPEAVITLVNNIRSQARQCGSKRFAAAPTIKWHSALAKAAQNHTDAMAKNNFFGFNASTPSSKELIISAGYTKASYNRSFLSAGRSTLSGVLDVSNDNTCSLLMDSKVEDFGLACSSNPNSKYKRYWVIYAGHQIHCPDGLTQNAMLNKLNQARSTGRNCGGNYHAAANPLSWSGHLAKSAANHANDMATKNYYAHNSQDGRTPSTRIKDIGYPGYGGENIAAGQRSLDAVFDGWLKSKGHCENIMNPDYQDFGMSCADSGSSDMGAYWVQNFGVRR